MPQLREDVQSPIFQHDGDMSDIYKEPGWNPP